MAKKVYFGVDGVARKVKKMYVGVGGVAKKVKKGYIGVGGVARPFFSMADTLAYYGQIDAWTSLKTRCCGCSVGEYALFAGGDNDNGYYLASVIAYNNNLVKLDAPDLSAATGGVQASALSSNYAIFNGGTKEVGSTTSINKYVNVYDKNLVKTNWSNTSNASAYTTGISVGDYAIFRYPVTGGDKGCIFNTSTGVKGTDITFGKVRTNGCAVASVGDYAIFAGNRRISSPIASVDAINSSLVQTTDVSSLTTARAEMLCGSVGNYAVFAGGYESNHDDEAVYNTVDTYTSSLVHSTASTLWTTMYKGTYEGKGVTIKDYLLFAGCAHATTSAFSYTKNLARTRYTLANAQAGSVLATSGDYIYISGTITRGPVISPVEVFTFV